MIYLRKEMASTSAGRAGRGTEHDLDRKPTGKADEMQAVRVYNHSPGVTALQIRTWGQIADPEARRSTAKPRQAYSSALLGMKELDRLIAALQAARADMPEHVTGDAKDAPQ